VVRFGSIRVSSPRSGEHISRVVLGMSSGRLVWISGLGLILPNLLLLTLTFESQLH